MSKPKRDRKVILWDIDETLVASRDSRVDKHVKAAELFLGRDLPSQKRMGGKTDRQILLELLEPNGCIPNPVNLSAALGILDKLSIEEIRGFPIRLIPGVETALEMSQDLGWINGLITGNTPVRAQTKLQSASIWESFDPNFTFFGDQSPNRFDLVSLSLSTIQSMGDFEVIIVGDTPLDVQSAQKHGLQVVAVATGLYSADELSNWNPDLLIIDWETDSFYVFDFLTCANKMICCRNSK